MNTNTANDKGWNLQVNGALRSIDYPADYPTDQQRHRLTKLVSTSRMFTGKEIADTLAFLISPQATKETVAAAIKKAEQRNQI